MLLPTPNGQNAVAIPIQPPEAGVERGRGGKGGRGGWWWRQWWWCWEGEGEERNKKTRVCGHMWCQIYIHSSGNPKRRRQQQQQQQRAAAAVACMCPDTSPWPCRLLNSEAIGSIFHAWAGSGLDSCCTQPHTHAPSLTRAVHPTTHTCSLSHSSL